MRLLRALWLGMRAVGALPGGLFALLGGESSGASHVDVERRHVDVSLYGGVSAVEFDGLLGAGDGIDGAAEDVAFGVAVDVAGGLLNFVELRLALEIVEQEDAGIFGEAQSGSDLRKLGFLEFVLVFEFFVELDGFGDGAPAARPSRYFSVAGQSTREVGISSHSRVRRCM